MSSITTTSPSKEQFCSFISEFIDKSKKIIVESEDVLDYDAVELTLLLKSIGFQLQSLEFFSKPDDEAKDIEIEIKCKRSGLHSKLKMITNNCTCPINDPSSNNNSFWEVQGIAPVSGLMKPQGLVQDTSCNLLPEITKKTNNLARTMLTILQQHYKADFDPKGAKIKQVDVKEILERFQSKNINMDSLKPNTDCPSPNNVLKKSTQHCSTPLSSINVDSTALCETNLTVQVDDGDVQAYKETNGANVTSETDVNYVTSIETANNGINFAINNILLKDNDTFDQLNPENEKEICLIENITEARKNLDTALLLLKCNVTREISPGSSILTVTPQNLKKKGQTSNTRRSTPLISLPLERSRLANSNNLSVDSRNMRRHSVGGRNDAFLSSSLSPSEAEILTMRQGSDLSLDNLKRKPKLSPLTGKLIKPDTPRPSSGKVYGIKASLVKKALSTPHQRSANSAKPPINKAPGQTTSDIGSVNGIKKTIK
ncbi:uncharacterized protein LOC129606672 [Condylostylus longicornis]|uniref:uncharacterized protein LOC129606672 n=1 Tax=Condylostylus longicornis TaxID=2530218 RepID=UPI00244DAD51|nr:uncharacterized protein LOC129606672 [Condylostylus longicornis]